ncbi:hypothetical protein ASPZODRAFT_150923 [Penicilliopsis zonata CBS 506.65]|uniref:Major facilitator superfamily (MFS) profile domain-containing protein n=1 Tax=Penicilliopsis zonata CBS 506.65 TaxID=1073090 RepID=A0A1L9SNR6_9EURO|nr:hypothetical protein ASPZODRAFT_150923 [Penicilliopsis zonata CBS 506.65]OJJ48753.1 hypothetical protein ASPZODRAFT_150923 [Penicilliopsis zonata CBS 506.65]
MTVDPRQLPRSVRYGAVLTVNMFVFMGNMYSAGLATAFSSLAEDLEVSYAKLSGLVTWSVLSMGLANLFWMPCALCFGKRPVVLVSMAMFLGGTIWSAVAPGYNSLLASRVFASVGYGSIESLGPSILADLFYERHYASAMAVFAAFLSAGSQVGPMIAGYLVTARGWRWFFYLCSILTGANLLTTIFFLPETLYEPDVDETTMLQEGDADREKDTYAHVERTQASAMALDGSVSHWKSLYTVSLSRAAKEKGVFRHFATLFVLPLPLLIIPGVLLASIMYGVVLGGTVAISTLLADLLSPPPYLFSAADIGLFTFTSFIGILIAWPIAGPLTDLLSRMLRSRNNGVHKPEHRLPALLVPFLICPAGLVVFGYTMAREESYLRLAVGVAMSTAALALVPAVMLAYVVDAYPAVSGEALVLVNASKNIVAFGLAKGAVPWMESHGVGRMFYEMAGIEWAVLLLALPLYFAGPSIRSRMMGMFDK